MIELLRHIYFSLNNGQNYKREYSNNNAKKYFCSSVRLTRIMFCKGDNKLLHQVSKEYWMLNFIYKKKNTSRYLHRMYDVNI